MSTPIFSLTSFRQWLETKPPEETYGFGDWENCLSAQYWHAYGVLYNKAEGGPGVPDAVRDGNIREQIEYVAASADPLTFGAALSRCITLEQEQAS